MKLLGNGSRGRRNPALAVGDPVPDLVFDDERGERLSLRALRGRPYLIAVTTGPRGQLSAEGIPPVDDPVRAALRGLGAALLVVSVADPCFVDADDAVRSLRIVGAEEASAAMQRAFGAEGNRGEPAISLLVVDASGIIRRIHVEPMDAGDARAAIRAALAAVRSEAPPCGIKLTRREVMIAGLIAATAALALDGCEPRHTPPPSPAAAPTGPLVDVKLNVNGQDRHLQIEPRVTLLDALRERLGLTGTKKGCDHGQCGACTVLVDGRRINACLTLAVMHQKAQITTIEGLAHGDELHPMQAAFLEHDALQCGYCTPGQIMSAVALVKERRASTDAEVRELMSGNICRCGAYPNIVAAIQSVQRG